MADDKKGSGRWLGVLLFVYVTGCVVHVTGSMLAYGAVGAIRHFWPDPYFFRKIVIPDTAEYDKTTIVIQLPDEHSGLHCDFYDHNRKIWCKPTHPYEKENSDEVQPQRFYNRPGYMGEDERPI